MGPSLTDIHCHILPELDDGAGSWDEAVAMARLSAADGITTIVATPHQLGTFSRNHGQHIREQTVRFQQRLQEEGVALRVLPGAEIRVDPALPGKLKSGELLTLADRHRHALIELPAEVYVPLDRLLAGLKSAGLTAILAHPERNRGILARPEVLPPLVRAGCLLQITAGSLLGLFGADVQQLAERLVQNGLAQIIATDAHGMKIRRPLLARGFDRARRLAGEQAAIELCCRNPAGIAAGMAVDAWQDAAGVKRAA
jgi:protein-tyrosine phosphatase